MNYDSCGILTWVLVAVYAVLLPICLHSLRRRPDGGSGSLSVTALKTALSALCAAAAWVSLSMSLASYAIRSDIYFTSLMFRAAGLSCCVPGDLLLQYIRSDNRLYRAGIACFLAAQVLLIISLVLMDLFSGWVLTVVVLAGMAAGAFFLVRRGRWQFGREKVLLLAYIAALGLMTGRALASMLSSRTAGALVMFLGAALFLISDVFLGIWNYDRPEKRSLQIACWLAYFLGTMLIALSISPMFDVPLA